MFKLLASASVAFVAVSGVAGYLVPRRDAPAGWATDYLEPYQTYHTRYLALGCQSQHGKAFFDECCHPLLANESLSSRPAECTPSASASSSASAAEPTSTVATPGDDDDDDCDDESSSAAPSSTAAPASSSSSAQSSATSAPVNATPSSTHSSAPAATSAASSSSGLITGGFATFFYQNGVAGACGTVHSDNDLIAAIDQDRYGNSGVQSSLCGKKVQITNPANGKSVTVTIADDCPTCKNSDSIDLSYGAFTSIATEAEGMVNS
ncbi:barwin-like endoglucanase [Heliocybe sulcata]|uniref:Barwin-like endoglucanase n=1 Tax=Heliocybe sulcata TaxID=5364 RepID=A0A5C3NAC5_9AGAM|nr:barwin-like endoglucanase [Heliocybe sulcata]